MEAPARVRDTILSSGLCNSGGGFNHTASGLMTSVIELGLLQRMLKESRPDYRVSIRLLVCMCVCVGVGRAGVWLCLGP